MDRFTDSVFLPNPYSIEISEKIYSHTYFLYFDGGYNADKNLGSAAAILFNEHNVLVGENLFYS